MKRTRKIGRVYLQAVASGVAETAVRLYAPAILERGGPAGRARAEIARGRTFDEAVAVASKQGKGHVAEVIVAAHHSVDAGTKFAAVFSRPNRVANDPHVDVEVVSAASAAGRVLGVQVGVGDAEYVQRKAQGSQADQVVINAEARAELLKLDPAAYRRTTDRLSHGATASPALRGDKAASIAQAALADLLQNSAGVPGWVKLTTAVAAGTENAVVAFGRQLLYAVVHRVDQGIPIDGTVFDEAVRAAGDAFLRGTVETYVQVNKFLEMAGKGFDGQLLRRMGQWVIIASVIADVVIETAHDVVAWMRGEMTGEALARRFGVTCVAAVGSVTGWMLAARVAQGFGPLAPVVMVIGAWLGGKFGEYLGEQLLVANDFAASARRPLPATT